MMEVHRRQRSTGENLMDRRTFIETDDLRASTSSSVSINGVRHYRLYAIVNRKQHFLIERGEQDLLKLARFMSFHTGWQLRP